MSRRKAYRPKLASRPVMQGMRDELVLPAYAGLETLRASGDQDARNNALIACGVLFAYIGDAAADKWGDDAFTADLDRANAALAAVKERHARTGLWGTTGPELIALRRAVEWCDEALPLFGTARLTAALVRLYQSNEAMA